VIKKLREGGHLDPMGAIAPKKVNRMILYVYRQSATEVSKEGNTFIFSAALDRQTLKIEAFNLFENAVNIYRLQSW
jgi:hypothetical protein